MKLVHSKRKEMNKKQNNYGEAKQTSRLGNPKTVSDRGNMTGTLYFPSDARVVLCVSSLCGSVLLFCNLNILAEFLTFCIPGLSSF